MRFTLHGLVGLLLVIVMVHPTVAEEPGAVDHPRPNGMEYIRLVFNQPEVRTALKNRGYNEHQINRRLRVLDRSLTDAQERALAQRLRDRRSESPAPAKPSAGNAFLGTTLDILTEILLIPIKIIAWIIPGL